MLDQTLTQLRQLKLTGMAKALVTQQEQPGTYEALSAYSAPIRSLIPEQSDHRF